MSLFPQPVTCLSVSPACEESVPSACDYTANQPRSELEICNHPRLSVENAVLRLEIQHLKASALSFSASLLSDSELLMYTGVTRKVFDSLLTWLHPVIQPKKRLYSCINTDLLRHLKSFC